jgi:transposase-like protein
MAKSATATAVPPAGTNLVPPPPDDPGGDTGNIPNWVAAVEFNNAQRAAHQADTDEIGAQRQLWRALCEALRLIEHYRTDHKDEITQYLRDRDLKNEAAVRKDDVLCIVKEVFAGARKNARTVYVNALRQAIKEKRGSDDLLTYFGKCPPSAAALEWRNAQPKATRADGALSDDVEAAIAKGRKPVDLGPAVSFGDDERFKLVLIERDVASGKTCVIYEEARKNSQIRPLFRKAKAAA